MLLTDEQIKIRIESPLNLLNRLRKSTSPTSILSVPPTAEQLIDNLDDKINKNSGSSARARKLLDSTLEELERRLPEVQKPEKLASIAQQMSNILSNEADNKKDGSIAPQIIVYAPQMRDEREFVTINMREREESEK